MLPPCAPSPSPAITSSLLTAFLAWGPPYPLPLPLPRRSDSGGLSCHSSSSSSRGMGHQKCLLNEREAFWGGTFLVRLPAHPHVTCNDKSPPLLWETPCSC